MFARPTRMLRLALALAAAGALCAAAAAGAAKTPITITASPATVTRGQVLRLSGAGWGVIEFCRPSVTLALVRSAPLRNLAIATVKLRTAAPAAGSFSLRWTVPRTVHSGARVIVATQRCQSGKDASAVLITRSTGFRVRP